jgi:hypothetical protein
MRPLSAVALLATVTQSSLLAQSDRCRDVLTVAYNTLGITRAGSIASAARNWFCSSRFKSDVQKSAGGGSITVPIKGIPFKFGGSYEGGTATESRDAFCSDASAEFSSHDASTMVAQVLNRDAVQAWVQCYVVKGRATAVQLSETLSGDEIVVRASHVISLNSGQRITPIVVDFLVTGADPIRGQWVKGAEVGPGGIAHEFHRRSEDLPVSITLMTTEGTSDPVEIPARIYPTEVGEIRVTWTETYAVEVPAGGWTRNR